MRAPRAVALALLIAPVASLPSQVAAADLGGGRSRIATPFPAPAVAEALPFAWSGLYFGAHGGYGWSDLNWQQEGGFSASHRGEGLLAGGQLGFNMQMGRFVYGIEGDISAGWIEGSSGDCCGHSIDFLYSVRGRAGLTSHDNRWLFYATGGAAWADFDYSTSPGSHSDTQFGWVAGGGIERALLPNLTAKVEYLYYDFDGVSAPAGTVAGGPTDLDPSMHTVRFGLNYKF
jgi:outer membrane immunogenic protein